MQYEHFELQPIEIWSQAWYRRSRRAGRSPAKLSHLAKRPLRRLSPGTDPVRQVRDGAGPEGDVDVGIELEQPLALRLGIATADREDLALVRLLQRPRLLQVGHEPLIRLFADRARVEDDDVRLLLGWRLSKADRFQHALDPLRVVGVHLASERRDVVALHGLLG